MQLAGYPGGGGGPPGGPPPPQSLPAAVQEQPEVANIAHDSSEDKLGHAADGPTHPTSAGGGHAGGLGGDGLGAAGKGGGGGIGG